MKIKQIALIGVAAILLAACSDHHMTQELIIRNKTGRNVCVVLSGEGIQSFRMSGRYAFDGSMKEAAISNSSMGGCTDRQSLEWTVTQQFLGDSVQVLVDSAVVATWYPSDTLADASPYNFRSPHYEYYEHSTFSGCVATYNVYTWTLTPEMINLQ